jgi:threonine aldolase
MVDRLKDDHDNAHRLAEVLAGINGLSVDPECVKTNIVYIDITNNDLTLQAVTERLNTEGVRVLPTGPRRMRAVTNYHVTSDDIEYTVGVFSKVLG